jgi:hypothetical protein
MGPKFRLFKWSVSSSTGKHQFISILQNIVHQMTRIYKPVLRKTRRRLYPKSAVENALKAVCDGALLKEVSRKYGIPISTLSDLRANKHPKSLGGQTLLKAGEEEAIARNIATLGDWGYPLDILEVSMLVRDYLQTRKIVVPKFHNNTPGADWVHLFLKRQNKIISPRMCRNISQKRGNLSVEKMTEYFHHLETTLEGIPPANIINYDETNLTDDPGQKKCIFRRGCKYPERVMNSTKASTSIMSACSAGGVLLHPYVVYKAEHLHDRWIQGGPLHARFNRSKSGWFDGRCFSDWFKSIILPFCKRLPGRKAIIGDNLSSHFSMEVIQLCAENDIQFVCLPPNTTHLCQPLDVSFFGPVKKYWRKVLTTWKLHEGRHLPTLPKEWFPRLLNQLLALIQPTQFDNIVNGFKKCGIVPLNPHMVLQRLSRTHVEVTEEEALVATAVSSVVINKLNSLRDDAATGVKQRKRKINLIPGKSISLADFQKREADPEILTMCDTPNENLASSGEDTENEEDIPILPKFPQPISRAASPVQKMCRIRTPVERPDFICF